MQVKAVCRLSQYGVWVNCDLGVLPLLPQSTTGGLLLISPMDKQQNKYMRIQITPAVDTTPPPWCQSSNLLLYFLPLDEQADW